MLMKMDRQQQASNPEVVARVVREILSTEDECDRGKEHFWVVGLNTQNVITYIDLVSLGILNSCIVHAREVYRTAIFKGVNAIIVVHNHPSNTLTPSPSDIKTTENLYKAGRILGISLLDSIIITDTGYYSFKAHNQVIK